MPHMTPEEFRAHGHAAVDWIADYWTRVADHPVLARSAPGEVLAALPEHPPETGEPFDAVLADLDRIVLPGITHWQHPSFFGYFPANASGPAVLGDLLSSGLGVQGMLWSTSPAATEVETRVMDWLAELLDLPERFRSGSAGGGVIQDSASSATLVATLAALHRAGGGAVNHEGIRRTYTVYTSAQAHSSVEKAVRIAGIGTAQLRVVDTDPDTLAMDPGHLAALVAADLAAGAVPTLVVATIGTTSTTAIDPVPEIGALCRERGIWLHVDAAYAGAAAVCPELRWSHAGVEYADSYCTDPHKWLLTNFDCDAFWVADRAELVGALSVLPEYLRNAASESGAVLDYRDWQVPLGRRFRALKLWSVLRWYGAEGLRAHVREGVAQARQLADRIRADERFEIVAPHPFGLVCFRLRGADGPNEALLAELNASGQLFLTHTRVRGAYTLRMALGGAQTRMEHVEQAWKQIAATASPPSRR
ncbi:MAG: pyridoxal-dependent decarboxylase [Cryptosporangiaceae bacterium]|jgi:aromatic-L-amino-acid decarboxylase|nr:pyridoxal-dependent decarboxylase [Cryptosporangiaceae bacterium]